MPTPPVVPRDGRTPLHAAAWHRGAGPSLRRREGPPSSTRGGRAAASASGPGSATSEHGSRGLSRFNRLFK
jgi:hypothetical protein